MPTTNAGAAPPSPFWLSQQDCRLDDFISTISQCTALADYPHAASVEANILVYDCDAVRALAASAASLRALQAEWGKALMDGPGVIVLQRAVDDTATLEQVSGVFRALIAEQHASGQAGGDHFAKPGANDRIWNAQQKLCLRAPEAFARYYANPVFAWIAEAWLGPAYQMTAQVNVVNPGGAAQAPHRDYHLGFRAGPTAPPIRARAPDVGPLDLAGRRRPLRHAARIGAHPIPALFAALPGRLSCLAAAAFPRLLRTALRAAAAVPRRRRLLQPRPVPCGRPQPLVNIRRMANLLQVSSPFGRAMEALDRRAMSAALYPALQALCVQGDLDERGASHAIAACAEGYAFPSNLDRDQPIGGMAPPTQQQLMHEALAQHWPAARFLDALDSHAWRQQA